MSVRMVFVCCLCSIHMYICSIYVHVCICSVWMCFYFSFVLLSSFHHFLSITQPPISVHYLCLCHHLFDILHYLLSFIPHVSPVRCYILYLWNHPASYFSVMTSFIWCITFSFMFFLCTSLASYFSALTGFQVHPFYEDFSTPCFDGLHHVIQGTYSTLIWFISFILFMLFHLFSLISFLVMHIYYFIFDMCL